MAYKRILTVQDISCVGQCSATVALPILSVCGHEACILPSAVLSTHSGGFGDFIFHDLTEDMPKICRHWKKENIQFDAVYTGYLGSQKQIDMVKKIFSTMLAPGGARIVDPAMADNGKLYDGFDNGYIESMKKLCLEADVIIPNLTEACMLTGEKYQENFNISDVDRLLNKLSRLCSFIILTGTGRKTGESGVSIYRSGKTWHYGHPKINGSYHGTGDIFASAFTGAWLQGLTPEQAVKIAADYTASCIEATRKNPAHWYGVKFETQLPRLYQMICACVQNDKSPK